MKQEKLRKRSETKETKWEGKGKEEREEREGKRTGRNMEEKDEGNSSPWLKAFSLGLK